MSQTDDPRSLYMRHAETLTPERADEIRGDTLQAGNTQPVRTDVQLTALDLYTRGLNVFPIRHQDKKPYILRPLFTARLHHCSPLCSHKGQEDITGLFQRDNIAVMTGRTSGNLLAIDCDSHEAFERVGEELTRRRLAFWAITGRRGGTYLFRVIEGEASSADKTAIPDVQLWGNRHLVVLPPSIHPSGIMYQWATPEPRYHLPQGEGVPAVSIRALDWLGVTLAKSASRWQEPELFNLPQWAAMLSYTNRETFAGAGVSEGNRNTKLFAALCDMQGNGIEYHEAQQIAREYAQRAGLSQREAMDTLKSAYSQQRTPARRNGNGPRAREWQRAQALAESFDWRGVFGRKALKRRAAYMACIERAKLDGRLHWRATVREIAELANMNKETAADCLQDLASDRAGLIKRTSYEDAGVYRFLKLSESYNVQDLDTPKTQGEQDVFSKLGLTAWHVWRYLLRTQTNNVSQMARELRLPQSTVSKALKTLQHDNVRLVSRAEGMYYGEPRTEASLQSMALFWHDGASPSQERKNTHRVERERRVNQIVKRARARWAAQADA